VVSNRKHAQRSSLLARLSNWLRKPGARSKGKANKGKAKPALADVGQAAQRTPEQWKQVRSATRAAVRGHLEAQQPIPAIKKLTLALIEDPEFQPYHDLLGKAVEQRHARRLKPGQPDPWASMPKDLRTEAVKLEAFRVYVQELETLLDEAGIPTSTTSATTEGPSKKANNSKQ